MDIGEEFAMELGRVSRRWRARLDERLKETGALRDVALRTFQIGDTLDLNPFRVQSIAVTHSIPEPMALAIRTAAGTVLHTGDWKFDPDPLLGRTTDVEALKRLGDEGVLAMTCDSTNADVEGSTGSEASARAGLMAAFAGRSGAIAVTGFASNVARMKAVAQAAAAHDRKVVPAGRSMLRMEKAARACGFLNDLPPFIGVQEASWTDRRNLVLLCTGSQGEPRAALRRDPAFLHLVGNPDGRRQRDGARGPVQRMGGAHAGRPACRA